MCWAGVNFWVEDLLLTDSEPYPCSLLSLVTASAMYGCRCVSPVCSSSPPPTTTHFHFPISSLCGVCVYFMYLLIHFTSQYQDFLSTQCALKQDLPSHKACFDSAFPLWVLHPPPPLLLPFSHSSNQVPAGLGTFISSPTEARQGSLFREIIGRQ